MLETDAERMSFSRQILQELSGRSGGPWKEVCAETHPQYNEMVFWVLLYEDSDVKEAHKVFCDIFARHVEAMKPLQAYLTYEKLTEDGKLVVERMKGNEAVFSALTKEKLGGSASLMSRATSIFSSADSKR